MPNLILSKFVAMASLFRKKSGKGKDTTSSSSAVHRGKRARENPEPMIEQGNNEEVFRVLSGRKLMPTRLAGDKFLTQSGLSVNFAWMTSNAGHTTFVGLHEPTYKRLTLEFLSTFDSNISVPDADHFCSFIVEGHYEQVSLKTFCNIFNFRKKIS